MANGTGNQPDYFTRPASAIRHLVGLVGEHIAVRALRDEGHIVFTDWRKHITGSGIDLISLDPRTGELWVIDNKAQMRSIAGANALTGPQFKDSEKQMRVFFEQVWPNREQSNLALRAINEKKVKLAVSNGFAGETNRFSKKVFDKGLNVFDIRMPKGQRFYSDFGAWLKSFKGLITLRRGARITGSRGCVTVEGVLVVAVFAAGALYLLQGGMNLRQVAGSLLAQTALDVVLSRLPGGLFAGLSIGLESDETEKARQARKRELLVNELIATIPDFSTLSPSDLKASRDAFGELLDSQIKLEDLKLEDVDDSKTPAPASGVTRPSPPPPKNRIP